MSHFIQRIVMLSGLSLFILNVQAGSSGFVMRPPPDHDTRLALVIGNAAYAEKPLKNPVNDAKDMAKVLTGLGFQVVLKTDVNLRTMRDAVRDFVEVLSNGKVGLFYFSGHGNQYNGNNYLIPLEAKISEERDFQYEALSVMDVLERIQMKNKEGVNIIILDACRSNPFGGRRFKSGGIGNGLTLMGSPSGSLIAYATAPNEVADDNPAERNGIYTKHLLGLLREAPQENILTLFTRVRQLVFKETQGKQIPREENSLMVSEFCLATRGCNGVPPPVPPAPAVIEITAPR